MFWSRPNLEQRKVRLHYMNTGPGERQLTEAECPQHMETRVNLARSAWTPEDLACESRGPDGFGRADSELRLDSTRTMY